METDPWNLGDHHSTLVRPNGKTNCDVAILGDIDTSSQEKGGSKFARLERSDIQEYTAHSNNTASHNKDLEGLTPRASFKRISIGALTDKQKGFIQTWHRTFATDLLVHGPTNEAIIALATLVQASPQPILEYLYTEYGPPQRSLDADPLLLSSQHREEKPRGIHCTPYTVREANRHLSMETLTLVENYVRSCQRSRAQKDGRRSVNEGPLRCTYGCGYRTKRAFDWKRHEETHEPQELWLCHLCYQIKERSPFLVNRKDKFLRHVKDVHKNWEPETLLEMSRVDFQANFSPRCSMCPEISKSWDDRCRHVLWHYEEGIQCNPRQTRIHLEETGRKEITPN
jgi:hypothetical protein